MSAIYNLSRGKHSQCEGSHPLRQSLWKNESLAFLSYNYVFSPKLSLRSRVGVDWLQYRLHGSEKFSKLSPRVNLNFQYQLKGGMLLWSSSYNNYNYGMDLINQARIGLNPYLVQTGNPNLKSGCSFNSFLYYSGKIKKTGLSAILQYKLEHNPVVHDYYVQDTYLVRSFINRGNIYYYAAILSASHSFNRMFSLSGDIRYNFIRLFIPCVISVIEI